MILKNSYWLQPCLRCTTTYGLLPVFTGASRVGRLVGVARVHRLVVHVRGRRWAGFPGPSYARATATFLPGHAQLGLTTADGLGGEGQREAQQVHFTPEGIYLGGLGGEGQDKAQKC